MNKTLRALYLAPFRYDGISYIWDQNNEMVADFRGEGGSIRPRGWGRFQYMEDGTTLHDQMEALIISICAQFSTYPEHCVAALNAAWGTK